MTEQKQIEATLEKVSQQYESLFLKHPDLIFTLDVNGHFLRVNPAAVEIGGYSPQDVAGQSYLDFAFPADRETARQNFLGATAGKTKRFEIRGVHCDGHLLWLDIINMPIVIEGRIAGGFGIIRDVTQQGSEAALRKKTEELLRALDAASMMMWEWDTVAQQVSASGDPYPIYGRLETSGWLPADYARQLYEEDRIWVQAVVDRALMHKIPYSLECRVIWPDGATHWIEVRGHPFLNPEGHLCVAGIFMDITRRKLAEEALSRSHAELEQKVAERTAALRHANRELKTLSAHLQSVQEEERTRIAREIHDELGGVLTAIKYDLATGRKGEENGDVVQRRHVQSLYLIDAAIQSLRRIISDLRPSVLDDLGLWAALEWLAMECENRTGIPCNYVLKGPEIEVRHDLSVAVFRIVQELLTNVGRHSKATCVHLEVTTSHDQLALRIRDNGVGITKEQIHSRQSFGILGIHERVRFFNGSVRFLGHPGMGTTVSLKFPLTVHCPQA